MENISPIQVYTITAISFATLVFGIFLMVVAIINLVHIHRQQIETDDSISKLFATMAKDPTSLQYTRFKLSYITLKRLYRKHEESLLVLIVGVALTTLSGISLIFFTTLT